MDALFLEWGKVSRTEGTTGAIFSHRICIGCRLLFIKLFW
jgi:hypothetical protein